MTYPPQPEQPAWQQPIPQYQPPQAPKKRRRWPWISLGVFVILIVVIAVAANSGNTGAGTGATASTPLTSPASATAVAAAPPETKPVPADLVGKTATAAAAELNDLGFVHINIESAAADATTCSDPAQTACVVQSVPAAGQLTATTAQVTINVVPAVPPQEQQAIGAAQDYLNFSAFSRQGLIDQLDSAAGDGYPVDVATAAVDSLNTDWNAQAAKSAQQYLSYTHFSCSGLISQLDSSAGERFTKAQATYGAHQTSACG
jgi:hypothetical protein